MADDLTGRDNVNSSSASKRSGEKVDVIAEWAERARREAEAENAVTEAVAKRIGAGTGSVNNIDTDGGVNFSGASSAKIGGDVVAKDKIMQAGGDIVTGDKTTTTSGMSADEFAKAFSAIYDKVKALPPAVQPDVKEAVATIEQAAKAESTEGEAPNEKEVKAAANEIAVSAPTLLNDVADVALATLENPAKGVLTIIRKVLEKAKQSGASAA